MLSSGNLHGTIKAGPQRGHFQLRGPLDPVSAALVQIYLPPLKQPRAIPIVYIAFRSLRPPQLNPQTGLIPGVEVFVFRLLLTLESIVSSDSHKSFKEYFYYA